MSTDAETPTPRTDALVQTQPNSCGLSELAEAFNQMLDHARQLERELTALRAAHEAAQAEIESLRVSFAHYHANYGDGSDTCKECGLDLRNPVHFTEYRDKQIAKYSARKAK